MKTAFITATFLMLISGISAQISPAIKASIGYPYVMYNDQSISPDYHALTSFPTLAVEKPIPIEIRLKNRLTINPGIAYYYFKEHEVDGDKIKGKDFDFSHQTLNGYAKVMYQQKLSRSSEGFVYAGPIGGFHLVTKTKGTKTTYGLNAEIPEFTVDMNENGKSFFEMFYYGLVAGVQPNARKYNAVKVSFEVSWLPGFISLIDPIPLDEMTEDTSVPHTYTDVGLIQFSVLIGFRKR